MKRFFRIVLNGLGTALFLSAITAGTATAQEFILRYATQMPPTHHLTKADQHFAEVVAERTGGRVKIEVYPAGQLYKGTALVNAVRTGALDMGIIYGGAMTGLVPAIDIFDIPFLFSDYRKVQAHWNGKVGDVLRQQAESKGIRLLSFGAYGDSFAIINSDRPLRVPADFKGLKIRGNTPMSIAAIEALGASPLRLSSSEIYAALQRGTVDGCATGLGSIISRKWYEVSGYATITAASYSVWPVMINVNLWNRLPADIQEIIATAASENENYIISQVEKSDQEYAAQIENKMKAHVLTETERDQWKAALSSVKDKYIELAGEEGNRLLQMVD